MGKVLKSERSADNRYQITLWQNEGEEIIIEIKKFRKKQGLKMDYTQFEKMTFVPADFEKFKDWITKFRK